MNSTAVKFRYLHVVRVLKKILDFYIISSIHVAFSLVALAKISLYAVAVKSEFELLIFIFFSGLFAYNFIKFFALFMLRKLSLETKVIRALTVLAGGISCVFVFFLPLRVLGFVSLGAILVFGYTIPLHSQFSNWRHKKGWKTYLVVLSWVCLTVGVPLASTEVFDVFLFLKLLFLQGVYIFVAILPFEIGDVHLDAPELATLPQKRGVLYVKKIGLSLLVIGALISFFLFGIYSSITWSTFLVYLVLAIGLWKSHPKQSQYFARFWVEGIPILWCFLIYYF